jgi:hypothetical protein
MARDHDDGRGGTGYSTMVLKYGTISGQDRLAKVP